MPKSGSIAGAGDSCISSNHLSRPYTRVRQRRRFGHISGREAKCLDSRQPRTLGAKTLRKLIGIIVIGIVAAIALGVGVAFWRDGTEIVVGALALSAFTIGMAGFFNAAAGMLGAWRPEYAAIAALAVVAQSVASKIASGEAISQDARNGERYRRTRKSLTGLAGKLDEVRAAVARGNDKALAAFVESVHEQLSLEHRQWVETAKGADAATQRLLSELEKTQAQFEGGTDEQTEKE